MRKLRFTEIQWVAQGLTANHGRRGSSSAPKYPGLIPLCHAGFWVRTQHCGHTEDTQEKKIKNRPIGISVFWIWRIHSAWTQNVLRCQIAGGIPDCRHTLQASFGDWLLLDFQWGCQCQEAEMTAVRPDFQRSQASNGYGPLPHGVPYWIL